MVDSPIKIFVIIQEENDKPVILPLLNHQLRTQVFGKNQATHGQAEALHGPTTLEGKAFGLRL